MGGRWATKSGSISRQTYFLTIYIALKEIAEEDELWTSKSEKRAKRASRASAEPIEMPGNDAAEQDKDKQGRTTSLQHTLVNTTNSEKNPVRYT